MSVNRPQTFSAAFAILTLFAAAAWGQQKGTDIPVYESDKAIFGSNSVAGDDQFLMAALQEDVASELKAPTIGNDKPSAKVASHAKAAGSEASGKRRKAGTDFDSLFQPSSGQLVNRDGYFIAAAEGSMWKDAAPVQQVLQNPVQTPSVLDPLNAKGTANETAAVQPTLATNEQNQLSQPVPLGLSKLRLRVGFDALVWQRGRPEDEIFTRDDDGNEWSFGDFEFTEGTPRFFIQYMGDDMSGLEFTFFDFKSFSSNVEAEGTNVIPLFFQGSPANIAPNYDLTYTSRLKNVEFNSWIRKNAYQRRGFGIRHINLDENFNVLDGGSTTEGLFSRTDNDLWGLTRMWERRRPFVNRLNFTGGIDAGLYLNRVKIDVDTRNIDDTSEAKNLAASLGFNLGLEYQVANHVTLRAGYEGLGLFGVGTASDQSLEQDIFDGLEDPVLGSIYFGGFHFGAIATF